MPAVRRVKTVILPDQIRQLKLFPAGISLAALDLVKVLALMAMLIDHVNTLFITPLDPLMYALGRMAFPLFTLIWAMNVHGNPERLQHRANRLWMWALLTQPAFMLAFRHHLPGYALNILFVFAAVTQLLALQHRCGKKGLMTGVMIVAALIVPLTPGSFGMAGLALACSLAVVYSPAMEKWHRAAELVAVISLACLNGVSHLVSAPADTLLFVTLPTLVLPLLAVTLVQKHTGEDGQRFMPRNFFYFAYAGHLLLAGILLCLHMPARA